MTSDEFLVQMAKLSAAYRKDISGATAEVYFEALEDLHPSDLASAVSWTIKTTRFLPSPAEIRERAKHERVGRIDRSAREHRWALPLPAEPKAPAIPECVTDYGPGDVKNILADLTPQLSKAEQQLKPDPPVKTSSGFDPEDMEARMARATAMLKAFREYNAQQGVTW
jgi:hypothetical protein